MIGFSQLKVAILDFENTSGIDKYDGLGKAMSNMLITDLKNNIHPRKIVFMERSQLNKILDEQNIQKSKNFDKSTAVNFGKLAGVDFVIIGSIYVLDKHCNITTRMVNVETSQITHSKEVDGSINNWMTLKSNLAQQFANAVNNPISIENSNQTTSEGVLVQYSKVIKAIDENNVEKAESMISMMKDLGVDFEYIDFLSEDVNKLKEQLKELELELEISVADPIGASNNFYESGDYINSIKYLKVGQNRLEKNDVGGIIYYNLLLHKSYAKLDINKALAYCDSILNIYPYFEVALQAKYETLYHNGQFTEALNIIKPIIIDNDNYANPYKYSDGDLFLNFIEDYKKKKGLSKKRLKGFNYDPRGHGFVVALVDNYDKQDMHPHKQYLPHDGFGQGYSQGHSFDVHLTWLIKCMKELYTFEEIIIFLENIYFHEFGYIENFERAKYPNDRRKGSYASYNTDSVGSLNSAGRHVKLYFAKNNQTYSGDYHSFLNIWDSSGQNKIQDKWTQKGPEDCPCELLVTEEDIKKNNNKKTTNYPREINSWDEFNLSYSIAWYYLKNNHPEKSINIFIKLSDYLIGTGNGGDYYHMTKINLGHAYLLSGDLLKAQEIYKKYKLTGDFTYSWELTTGQTNDYYNRTTIKERYLQDWEEFYNDGVLSKKDLILIKEELNIK